MASGGTSRAAWGRCGGPIALAMTLAACNGKIVFHVDHDAGSGGSIGSGGNTGTGGMLVGSGGSTGTGGMLVGSGGTTGTGGTIGSGGTVGTAGWQQVGRQRRRRNRRKHGNRRFRNGRQRWSRGSGGGGTGGTKVQGERGQAARGAAILPPTGAGSRLCIAMSCPRLVSRARPTLIAPVRSLGTNCSPTLHQCIECIGRWGLRATGRACAGTAAVRPIPCADDTNCPGAMPKCENDFQFCIACEVGEGIVCAAPTPTCDLTVGSTTVGLCVTCSATSTAACTGTTSHCNTASGRCVQCLTSADCTASAGTVCNPLNNTCVTRAAMP